MEVKSAKELKRVSKELQENFLNRWKLLNLEQDKDRLKALNEKSEDPDLWNNPEEARTVSQKKTNWKKTHPLVYDSTRHIRFS